MILTRRPLVSGLALVGVVVVGLVVWRASADDTSDRSTSAAGDASSGGAGPTATSPVGPAGPSVNGSSPVGERASGPGTCAFLSTGDVSRAAGGASPVELGQSVGPSGGPGCEWVVGESRAPIQLEFDMGGPAANSVAPGDPVDGPWVAGSWSAASRTLHVDEGGGQAFLVRTTDEDADRARQIAFELALLVAARN